MDAYELESIVDSVLSNKRYAGIDRSVVRRICEENSKKYKKSKDIVKNARNDLHIMHESFLLSDCYSSATNLIGRCKNKEDLSSITSSLLELHLSTRERIPNIEDICSFISSYVNDSDVVGDLGCGFNPFSLPFWKTRPKEYYAYDLSTESIAIINKFFYIWNDKYKAEVLDVGVNTPTRDFDTVLLFKLIPLLQQQKKMRGYNLIKELNFRTAIISFPTKTMGGRNCGMDIFYSEQLKSNLDGCYIVEKQSFENEVFFILKKNV